MKMMAVGPANCFGMSRVDVNSFSLMAGDIVEQIAFHVSSNQGPQDVNGVFSSWPARTTSDREFHWNANESFERWKM